MLKTPEVNLLQKGHKIPLFQNLHSQEPSKVDGNSLLLPLSQLFLIEIKYLLNNSLPVKTPILARDMIYLT